MVFQSHFLNLADTPICAQFVSDAAACGGVLNAVCTDTGINSRTCECATGFSGQLPSYNIADNENNFLGPCEGKITRDFFLFVLNVVDTQICLLYGSAACNNVNNAECIDDGLNSRTCQCAAGYSGATPVSGIVDSDTSAGGFIGPCNGMNANHCFPF